MKAYSKRVHKTEEKSDVSGQPAQPPIKCPECESERVWKAGLRHTNNRCVQRFECQDCGYRFSDPIHMNKNLEPYSNSCRVCAPLTEGTKNLAKVEIKTEVRTSPIAEKIVNYLLYLKRIGRKDSTIETYNSYIKILSKSNLDNPEEIALFINENWKENSTRRIAVCVYDSFLKSIGQTWNKPKYKQESKKPFIPTDEELHQAILTGKKPNMTFSQLLYETGARTNEAERVQWEDIDYARKKSTSKHPKTEMHDSSQ